MKFWKIVRMWRYSIITEKTQNNIFLKNCLVNFNHICVQFKKGQ